jgi:hypothetical protein
MRLRYATPDNVDRLASVINAAYRVEDVFRIGNRIDADGVRDEMTRGTVIVLANGRR